MTTLIILVTVCLAIQIVRVQALPLPIDGRAPESSSSSSCDGSDCRTIWNIVWSCLLTMFACTWVSIHPNIPAPDETGYRMAFLRRLQFMALALITPELVIVWAMRQLLVARNMAKANAKLGWTQAHGFFALMGGFMLFDGDKPVRTLLLEDMKALARNGDIDFPDITGDEIKDRSTADMLSKGLVILQTGWFILQCIARHIQDLPITELELVTLAFAALNFATYALWWEKPLNVQCALRVPLRTEKSRIRSAALDEDNTQVEAGEDALAIVTRGVIEIVMHKIPDAILSLITVIFHDVPLAIRDVISAVGRAMRHVIMNAWVHICKNGLWKAIVNGVVFTIVKSLLIHLLYPIYLFIRLGGGENEMAEGAKSVPQFYSGKLKKYEVSLAFLTAMIIATAFGGIHCFAWSFEFPSRTEEILWRTTSIIITCVPAIPFVVIAPIAWLNISRMLPSWLKTAGKWLCVLLFIIFSALYIIARVFLLVLPFVSLRSLPHDAFRTVRWTSFIPHI